MAAIIYEPCWIDTQGKSHRMQIVSHDKAIKVLAALRDVDGLSHLDEQQLDYLSHVKSVHVSPYHDTAPTVVPEPNTAQTGRTELTDPFIDTDHLTHEGIYQSMDMAVPKNDR